jgi:hypothetical protein
MGERRGRVFSLSWTGGLSILWVGVTGSIGRQFLVLSPLAAVLLSTNSLTTGLTIVAFR